MSKSDVRKVAGSSSIGHPTGVTVNGFLLSPSEIISVRDYLRYAVECIDATIVLEESYGNRAPILQTLRVYAAGASELLERLK